MLGKALKTCLLLVAMFALSLGASAPLSAQEDNSDIEAKTVLVLPLTLVKDEDLDFGLILPGTSRGFVTLAPDGDVSTSGGILAVAGETSAATFYGYGRYRQFLRLNISRNRYQLRRQGGSETMRLDRITIGSTPPTQLTTVPRLFYIGSPDGFFGFSLGGRLRVNANQAPGLYVGEIEVTVEYL